MGQAMIMRRGGSNAASVPVFTYTGSYDYILDSAKDWRVKFLTSGTLIFNKIKGTVDLFLVGGGGGGNSGTYAGGGGGGYTGTWKNVPVAVGTVYSIVVGAGGYSGAGGTTSALGHLVSGGLVNNDHGGNGGSGGGAYSSTKGGYGGSNGGNGETIVSKGGTGQGFTTGEFGEPTGALYGGGGGGGVGCDGCQSYYGVGGSGGGGRGGAYLVAAAAGKVNTGGGGGGCAMTPSNGAAGGSGIVILRNFRG